MGRGKWEMMILRLKKKENMSDYNNVYFNKYNCFLHNHYTLFQN